LTDRTTERGRTLWRRIFASPNRIFVRRENLSHAGKEIFFSRSVHFLPIGYLSADEFQVARSLIWNKIPEMTMAIIEQYFDEVTTAGRLLCSIMLNNALDNRITAFVKERKRIGKDYSSSLMRTREVGKLASRYPCNTFKHA